VERILVKIENSRKMRSVQCLRALLDLRADGEEEMDETVFDFVAGLIEVCFSRSS